MREFKTIWKVAVVMIIGALLATVLPLGALRSQGQALAGEPRIWHVDNGLAGYFNAADSVGEDKDEDGIDDYEEENGHVSDLDGKIYFTDNRSESTDRDPYDDGQEVDGHSPADLGNFGGQMPASVMAPGKHPLVPSYPDLKVDLVGMAVIPKCTITSTETKKEGSGWTLETETTERTKTKGKVGVEVSPLPPFVSVGGSVSIEHETTVRTLESTSGWTEEEWSMATAVQPHDAAKLEFHLKIRNDGTDLAQNVKLTFNVKIGDKVVDTVWTGETPIAGLIDPGEVYPPVDYILVDSDKDGNDIAVTLDELKSIELGAPISIQIIETITEVPWGNDYRDWAPYISDIEEISARIMFDFGGGNVKDYRVWSGIRYLPSPPWEEYIMDVTLGDAMDWIVGVEEKEDGIYIDGVIVEEWGFGFYHDTYEDVVEELGPEWSLYDLLNLTIKQGWTIVVKVPDTKPPEIHWAGYTGDMKTIRASVSDNEHVANVTAHVKVGNDYRDIELEDDDGDLIFTATLSEEITDTYDDYVIASDENLVAIWNNIRIMPDWWRMFRHDASHTGSSYSTAPDNNNVSWSRVIGSSEGSPAVAEGKVFVSCNQFDICCLNEDTGGEEWNYTTGSTIMSCPAVAHGRVFVGSGHGDNKIYCLDEDTGNKIWSYETEGMVWSSPAVADGKVFVGSGDYKVYCLDEDTGNKIWSYTTGSSVTSSPAVVDGKVFIGSNDNKVYCLDKNSGNKIWSYTTRGPVTSSPAVAYGKVFVGSHDNNIYCLYENGNRAWTYITGDEVHSSPAVADEKVFVGSDDGKIYCLDGWNGDLIWSYETGGMVRSSPAVADGKVFVGSIVDHKIYCLDEDNGELIWSYDTGSGVSGSPAVADGKVFVGSGTICRIYCFASLPLLPPGASIDSISPDPAEQGKDTIEFRGQGSDLNGSVVAYHWESNIDGFLSDEEDFDKPASELSLGTHTIFFKVKDNDGLWSTQDIEHVKIVAPPRPTIAWVFSYGTEAFLCPTPVNNRPYLDAAVALPTGTEPTELLGIYHLNETTGNWDYFIPGFGGSTLTSLKPGEAYIVAVSGACTWNLPCGEGTGSPTGNVWSFPSTSDVFLAPTSANGRLYLDAAVALPTGTEPAQLLGVYELNEATGVWSYFIPGFASSTLNSLEPGEVYLVAVSSACNWQLS